MNPANSVEEIARGIVADSVVMLSRDLFLVKAIADALRAERERASKVKDIHYDDLCVELDRLTVHSKTIMPGAHSVYEVLDEVPSLRAQLAAEQQKYKDMHAELVEECEEYQEESDLLCKQLVAERERGESDRKRLDWLIEKTAMVVEEEPGNWFIGYMTKEPSKTIVGTPRECIDAVMLPAKPEVGE